MNPNAYNDVHTGAREMLKITKLLKDNGYDYVGTESKSWFGINWYGFDVLLFTKDIQYTDWFGNWINDSHITVKIEFDKNFVRHKPNKEDEEDEDEERSEEIDDIKNPINEEMLENIIDGETPEFEPDSVIF